MHFPDACIEGPVATLVPSQDWSEVWKREYKTIRVGRVLIKPTWAATPEIAPGSVLVTLDPQMAFGTGSHASTQLALEALQACIRPGQVLADIGTGTGILAIAAALLGARRVYAVDNDPIAVRAARANCRLNGVDKMVELRCAESLSGLPQALDGIVANISPHVDIELARAAPRYLKPGAFLILSGFTEKSEEEVTAAMLEAGFSISTRYCEGEWVCLAAAFLPDDEVG
jgi:ribosomal protein L11 methyltransferase